MRKSLALFLVLLGTAPLAKAQGGRSKVDLYGGFYYTRFNVNANVPGIATSATYIGKGGGWSVGVQRQKLARSGGRSGRLLCDQ